MRREVKGMPRTLIKGGRVIDGTGVDAVTNILVDGDAIAQVGPDLSAPDADVVDAAGKMVVPGLIDLKASLGGGTVGGEHESVVSLGMAAARGGFTSVLVGPSDGQPLNRPDAVRALLAQAGGEGTSRLHVAASLTADGDTPILGEAALLKEAGAVALAARRRAYDASFLRGALQYTAMVGLPLWMPAGDGHLDAEGAANEGPIAAHLGLPGAPAVAEAIGVATVLLLAADTGCPVTVGPISTAQAVDLIAEAKAKGAPVTACTTFHHLVLTEDDIVGFAPGTKVWPPLRTAADRQALLEGVKEGVIDFIVTDHTPHPLEATDVEWLATPFGIAGLETAVAASITYLLEPGRLSWRQWLERTSFAPARALGIPGGRIAAGEPANLTIIDPGASWTVDVARFASHGRNNPFHGRTLKGLVVETWVAGRRIVHPSHDAPAQRSSS